MPLTNGDLVVVVDGDQVAELQVTSHGRCLAGNTLHCTSITEEGVCVVIDQVKSILIELCCCMCLCDSETDSIGETLAEGTSGHLNAWSIVRLRVTWGNAVDLAEGLQVVNGDCVAEEVEECVLQHAAMAVSEKRYVSGDALLCHADADTWDVRCQRMPGHTWDGRYRGIVLLV